MRQNVSRFLNRYPILLFLLSLIPADLQPPAARPASTARVAQRMIAGALSQQGVRQALMAKGRTSAEEVKKQERQRRERLQTRAQLRDEAWGSDDD